MPVIVRVNVSRKLTKDFQSQGYGLEVQSELPHSVLENPDAMAAATDHLFTLATDLLEEQVRKAQGNQGSDGSEKASAPPQVPGNPQGNGNGGFHRNGGGKSNTTDQNREGQGSGNNRGAEPRGITDAQAKAIENIARRLEEDPNRLSQDEFGKTLRELSLRDASKLIDNLKKEVSRVAGVTR